MPFLLSNDLLWPQIEDLKKRVTCSARRHHLPLPLSLQKQITAECKSTPEALAKRFSDKHNCPDHSPCLPIGGAALEEDYFTV